VRDADGLRAAVERWYELWNLGDKEAWLDHWRAIAPGDPQIEDPVGTPVKRGWEMASELWDRTGGANHFKIAMHRIIVSGNEVAAVYRSDGAFAGKDYSIESVDIHRFEGDALVIRTYFEIPRDLPYMQWTSTVGEPVLDSVSHKGE
jgi:hypothetical protein